MRSYAAEVLRKGQERARSRKNLTAEAEPMS